jgi:DNA polymerase
MFKEQFLLQIKDKILACKNCPLGQKRKFPVIGQGNHSPAIMFVGEAIGNKENETGIPFSGTSKAMFEKAIYSIGLTRKDIYCTSLLKCKYDQSVASETCFKRCSQYLFEQIDLLQPKIICTMGHYPTKMLLEYYENDNFKKDVKEIHGESILINPIRKHKKHKIYYVPTSKLYIVPTFSTAETKNFQIQEHIINDMIMIKTLISLLPILF